MGDRIRLELNNLPADLQTLAQSIERTALVRRGDEIALLELLRLLESLHAHIRDELFQDALPTNRQRLYALLRDIEVNGGWPYIQRLRLKNLLDGFELAEPGMEDGDQRDSNR
ncbi:hypothetical protein PN498_02925 [Oscillatoria sp. CS-180]|uniref:hypothetical protein n=1 Tax=Oscillatoria sp. CS-180 TaxID=3021720 RepID=UPI00232C13F6|nr:hypothetical protein [Oscillatoria sp. CS-180]MDB9524928.1 hypothetical protein [Oscillatoria sp. CS-180]